LNSQPLTPTLPLLLRRQLVEFAPDVVHLHFPNPLAAFAWRIVGRPRGSAAPALAIWHHADITRQRRGRVLVGPWQQWCLRRAAGVLVSSGALAAGSRELQRHRDKVAVVPFGIDPAPWSAHAPTGNGPFLFVGRLVAYKGIEILLQALREAQGVVLDVVGAGPRAGALRRLADKLGVAPRVNWLGTLSGAQLAARLASARALILPSVDTSETFGLVQLEAMAAGVPVVATDLPTGVREVASEASHLLVPPGDIGALAAALRRLADDAQLARSLGEAGRARLQASYTRNHMTEALLRWYAGLAGQPRT
jgi:glycosyltransferase involved in cell wall biosynthesis